MRRGYNLQNQDIELREKLGFNKLNSDKFNFAVLTRTKEDGIEYQDFWILSNAYYDYNKERFIKIDFETTSFAIQIQGKGTYPGESELGYLDNPGINFWRNPPVSAMEEYSNEEDLYYLKNEGFIGSFYDGIWREFAVPAGWYNGFMLDSFGGMTIGGAGFEIDGYISYPYSRLSYSRYNDGDKTYYLLGLIWNGYHPTKEGWDCDSEEEYSWFVGLKTEEKSDYRPDLSKCSFVVMYNDTPNHEAEYNSYFEKDMKFKIENWKTIFDVSPDNQYADLNEKIIKNNEEIAILKEELVNTKEEIAILKEELVNTKEEIAILKEEINKLKNK